MSVSVDFSARRLHLRDEELHLAVFRFAITEKKWATAIDCLWLDEELYSEISEEDFVPLLFGVRASGYAAAYGPFMKLLKHEHMRLLTEVEYDKLTLPLDEGEGGEAQEFPTPDAAKVRARIVGFLLSPHGANASLGRLTELRDEMVRNAADWVEQEWKVQSRLRLRPMEEGPDDSFEPQWPKRVQELIRWKEDVKEVARNR